MPRVEKIVSALEHFLDDQSVARGRWWAEELCKELDPDTLEEAVEEDMDIIPLLTNHWHLESQYIRGLASDALKICWNELEPWLLYPTRLMGLIISESPDPERSQEILDQDDAREYIYEKAEDSYHYLYDLAWEEEG